MEILIIFLLAFFFSSSMFIFWVVKGGFNKKFLYTDNLALFIVLSGIITLLYHITSLNFWIITLIIEPFIAFLLFIVLFFYRFFRNPNRKIIAEKNEFVSPADGRIIYIKEIEANQIPVSVKRKNMARIEEITKTNILEEPCYLIGIAMTLFDVHINRAPIDGKVILVKHTPGAYLGLNSPESTFANERNTIVIEREDGIKVGVVQIAAKYVKRCIASVKEGENVSHGGMIGKIRWGSQADLIIPRNTEIYVREGEQVQAGSTLIGKYLGK